jgi:hypothetical protein
MSVIQFNIPDNPHHHRQFCTVLDNVLLKNTGEDISDGTANNLIEVIHNTKKVKAGIDKDTQKIGDKEIYYPNEYDFDDKFDYVIDEDVFLFFDGTGINYIHFFFDLFGKCIYFDILKKDNPKLKLGIPEEFYEETGKNSFIKQWLNLYYNDLEVIVFKKNTSYQIKKIILPNCLFWFPEGYGHGPIIKMIRKVYDKIDPIEVIKEGCYISRQDTIKHGWYHGREMQNELELIDKIKSELDYDIIELMNYNLKEKIQIFKSYKTIIQQSSASNVNILFAAPESNSVIISNPRMGDWLNGKCYEYSLYSGSNLLLLEGVGELIIDPNKSELADKNNYPWYIPNLDGLIEVLKQVKDNSVWNS